ncbi:conserved Plasmodium protein, unknown function [Plasmodium knowlesi strain H]|uniref:Uncharacterized protein n=2 Tax=Plasmodium knowlesi TaxID=5850 RepID=A0A679KW26_PLAKH|nr:conserved Plasmodium protein, unknown function [Plasmodium knowlesi strain H]OTN66770.1 Uncharacterized protein PKNOH_S08503600 [Plasmodium knowlesi]CAA9986695.1 conserved Plasmodium protein, unknown function [Plasmodium knowlesi strain H]VVS76169.1 conserved Plasmodium protein, unknown function [Plasmodium knowlesi strain H]
MDDHHLDELDEGSRGIPTKKKNSEKKPPPKGKTNKRVEGWDPPPHSPERRENQGTVDPQGNNIVSRGEVNNDGVKPEREESPSGQLRKESKEASDIVSQSSDPDGSDPPSVVNENESVVASQNGDQMSHGEVSSKGDELMDEEKPGEDNSIEEAASKITSENKSLEGKPSEEKPPVDDQSRGSLAHRSAKSGSTNTENGNLIKINQKSEEWEQPKKWSLSLLLTNIKSMVLTNYIYVAKRCGMPNQPNKPGPVLAISVEKENTNEVKNIIVQTPCAYEKYTLKGKLIQHKTLYPCTVTCMMYGSIGGIGKTVILGLQNGCILVYKSIEFECILKLNTRECLEKYFKSSSSTKKPFNNSHVKSGTMGVFSGTNEQRDSGKFSTQGANSKDEGEDYNDLSYQISGLSVKSTFANFIHWIIAGNMQGYIFVWEVPSGNIIKILVHPHHLFSHVNGGSRSSDDDSSDDSSDSGGSSDTSDHEHGLHGRKDNPPGKRKKKKKKKKKKKALPNGSNGGEGEKVMDASYEKEEDDDDDESDDEEEGCFTLEDEDLSSKPDGEENSSEFSGDNYLSDSDENYNSSDEDNDNRGDDATSIRMLHGRKKKKKKKKKRERNAPNKCYVSAILAVTHKYELWVAFGSGYIAVYDLYDFQLLLYTCISKSPIMDLKYSKLLEDVFLLIGNNYISVWDTKTLKQIKKVPTSHVTKKNSSLSTLYLLERPTFWKCKKVVLIAGCNDGSISVTNVTKKMDGDLTFSYVRTYEKHFEPYVPISYICIHPSINAAFVGDASGVVFTVPRILNTLKHEDTQR